MQVASPKEAVSLCALSGVLSTEMSCMPQANINHCRGFVFCRHILVFWEVIAGAERWRSFVCVQIPGGRWCTDTIPSYQQTGSTWWGALYMVLALLNAISLLCTYLAKQKLNLHLGFIFVTLLLILHFLIGTRFHPNIDLFLRKFAMLLCPYNFLSHDQDLSLSFSRHGAAG